MLTIVNYVNNNNVNYINCQSVLEMLTLVIVTTS